MGAEIRLKQTWQTFSVLIVVSKFCVIMKFCASHIEVLCGIEVVCWSHRGSGFAYDQLGWSFAGCLDNVPGIVMHEAL